jgi:hypothetical protein
MAQLEDPAARAARNTALLVVQPELGCLTVVGADRAGWLNAVLTCDAASVAPGGGAWGLSLTKQGKIVSDMVLVADGEHIYLSAAPGRAAELHSHLDRMLVMEDAELSDDGAELAWLFLHGPQAREIAAGAAVRAWGEVDITGLGGAVLVVPRAELSAVAADIARATSAHLGGAEDWERLRVERGVPAYGVDYDSRDNPHDASLDQRAVCWTKGCYLGQEVVYMQDARGKTKRRVVPLLLAPGCTASPEAQAHAPGVEAPVGELTTVVESNVSGRPMALCRLDAAYAEPGTRLSVAGADAEVVAPV